MILASVPELLLQDLPQLAELMSYAPVRSTSKLLKPNSQAQAAI